MELKERIILASQQAFRQTGISAVTMDMIAHRCGISKRTLYEQFADKRTLVSEVINYSHKQQLAHLEQIFHESPNCLEALLKIYRVTLSHIKAASPALISDMQRFYPQLYLHRQNLAQHNVESFAKVVEHGKEQGVFRTDIDSNIIATIFFVTIRAIHSDAVLSDIPPSKHFSHGFITFLRGIATIKGIEIIDEFLQRDTSSN